MSALLGLAGAAATPAAAQSGLTAVWRPGSGTQWWRSGMTFADFQKQDATYFAQGLRIQSLSIRGGRVAAVWRPGTGAQWVRWGMSVADLQKQDQAYFSQGLRLSSLVVDGGQLAAVWRPGAGTQWWQAGMTGEQFAAQDSAYFKQGLRISSIAVSGGRISAVWRPGSGAQWVKWGMTGAQYAAQDNTYFSQGLRQTSVAVDGNLYAAVWQTGGGTQWAVQGYCAVDLSTQDSVYFGQGLRLAALALQDSGASPWGYPWKNGDSFNVAQGNNDAGGSHNGVQAYAFDFALPSGTTIRATRDGTVEWLQSNLTETFNPNADVTAANTPFPNGSLKNWGNAVRIRHAGGLTSWYFHIEPNSMLVKVGDRVTAGQAIAKSDNTGRTSGPHLHFQIQADSVDWGPSVPMSFNRCEVPVKGDKATSRTGN